MTHTLSARRSSSGTDPLLTFLRGALGKPVTLDLSKLDTMDAMRLQILVSGQRQWALDSQSFQIKGISDDLRRSLTKIGVDETMFQEGVKQ
ncbi:MAG: STAS domain-containing protein [Rhodobacteraceae bacterium]|nr:STAS domain-containing protein [Paracoccaceae bacterium]